MRKPELSILVVLACFQVPVHAQTGAAPDVQRVMALAKMYFRDCAELPMDVAVTTVVTDARGKLKRRSQAAARLLFRGYNQEGGRFSLSASSGWTNPRAMRESMSGDLAVFFVAMGLVPRKEGEPHFEIQQPARPGEPFLVNVKAGECSAFKLLDRFVFPQKPCISTQFRLAGDPAGDLVFQHFSFEVVNLPAAARIADFGDVQVLGYHCEGDF